LRIAAALEKISKVSRDENVLLPTQVDARMLEVANYQVFNQFDLDLTDVRFEENKRLTGQRRDQQEIVINLNYMDNITPRRRNRAEGSQEPLSSSAYGELTTREIEVLRLLAMGLSNKQIAERLVLSPHTVSGHIQSIFGKLALNSRSAATRYALEHHLT
jgi:DNA-binding CsgD family transcriptional regulator